MRTIVLLFLACILSANVAQTQDASALRGRRVFSSDQWQVGVVHAVETDLNGKITNLRIKINGFLGFGGKLVVITKDQWSEVGDNIMLTVNAEDVNKLPEMFGKNN